MSSRRRYPDTEPQQQTAGAQRMPQKRLQASAEKETYFFVKRKSTALWKNKIEKTKAFTVTVDEEMEAADRAIAGERKLCVCLSALSIFSWRGGRRSSSKIEMSIPQAKHEMRIGVLNEVLKIGVLGMRSGIETSVCRENFGSN